MKFFDPGFITPKKARKQRTITTALIREEQHFEFFTDKELYAAKGGVLVYDVECYINYFEIGFRCFYTDKIVYFERTATQEINVHKLLFVLHNFCIVGFNSLNYDIIVTWLALTGASTETLKNATNFIINGKMRSQEIETMYGFKMGSVNHIDLIEVAPGKGSLKAYASRLHAKRLQELPYPPDAVLTLEEQRNIRLYNFNDLEDTILLLRKLSPQLELRVALNEEFNRGLSEDKKIDLRSKSDAQIAEAVICSEIQKVKGRWPKRPKIETGTIYKYHLPDHIRFQDPKLNEMLFEVANAPFEIGLSKKDGQIVLSPKELENRLVKIGNTEYRLGIGGIHSTEKSVSHVADEQTLLIDRDVESYYPMLILTQGLYPEQVGPIFVTILDGIVVSRLNDKHRAKDLSKVRDEERSSSFDEDLKQATTGANSKKLIVNSTYGKLNDNWSRLRSPRDMVQVTLTGQLSLLMLIEMAELYGIPAISANTDGIVFKCPIDKYDTLNMLVSQWEQITKFKTEETQYKAIYSANVNNYIAVKPDGKLKAKGWYSDISITKNPTGSICMDAINALLAENKPIEETITSCNDITKFVTCRYVKGGGEQEGIFLGKIVRFYMSKDRSKALRYVSNGNLVPKSEGGVALMDLPDQFPDNVEYGKYIEETNKILYNIGYYKQETQQRFF